MLLVASLGFNAYFVTKELKGNTKAQESKADHKVLSNNDVAKDKASSDKDNNQLLSDVKEVSVEAESEELKAKIAELEADIEELKKPKVQAAFSDDVDTSDPAIAGAISASSNAMERFETESIDYAWSNDTKSKIEQVLVDNDLNAEVQVKEMECKTSVCKLTLSPYAGSSQGHLMGAGMKVLESISQSGQAELADLKQTFSLDTDEGHISIFLYNND